MIQYLSLSKIIATFTIENIVKRSLDALFLTVRNSRKISHRSENNAAVNALVYAWASPLLFRPIRQCEKPLTVEWQRVSIPTLSLFGTYGRGGVRTAWCAYAPWRSAKESNPYLMRCPKAAPFPGLHLNSTATVVTSIVSLPKTISTYISLLTFPEFWVMISLPTFLRN